jgi:hypothetical protein
MLTLLFVFHSSPGDCPHSLAVVQSLGDRLLLQGCNEGAELLLSNEPIDAIIIHQDHLQHGCDVAAKLRHVTPETPVILLRNRGQRTEMKPTGIAAVCTVDLGDEELVKSMWVFLRLILGSKQDRRFGSSTPAPEV